MPAAKVLELPTGLEARERVLTHRLEHEQPDLAVRDVAAEEAPGDERLEVGEEGRRGGERPCVVQRAATGEHREASMELALALAEQPVAPVDRRPQRALAFRKVDRPLHVER